MSLLHPGVETNGVKVGEITDARRTVDPVDAIFIAENTYSIVFLDLASRSAAKEWLGHDPLPKDLLKDKAGADDFIKKTLEKLNTGTRKI
ncbi:MAG TPA: hypothetical protein VLH19_01830 [Patescibacteria group bacterium]|nr:hypothetical protein [Patescibacteria group bacterium]